MADPVRGPARTSANPVFTGVAVALITLFDDRGDLDIPANVAHAQRLVESGMRAVVVAGSTGEANTLTNAERGALVESIRGAVGAPVLVGTGAPSRRQAAELTKQARDGGADAVLALSPPRVADPRPYYDAVAEAAGRLPVLAYHFPAASSPGIDVSLLPDLPVVGLKDSSGDAERMLTELARFDGDVYVGSTVLAAYAGQAGCAGAILAVANAYPEMCVRAFGGDFPAQRDLIAAHIEAKRFPHGLKRLVNERFGTSIAARHG